MKRYFTIFILFAALIFSFYTFRHRLHKIHKKYQRELNTYGGPPLQINKKYDQKPIVAVVLSYNNSDWCEKNLDSIFSQNYQNYRLIYVDDCSTDDTYEKVLSYIEKRKMKDRSIVIKNKNRSWMVENFYRTIHKYCKDGEIVATIDGDDWLAHMDVFSQINSAYSSADIWLTYGSMMEDPSHRVCSARPFVKHVLQRRGFRKHPWVATMLRTFYADLFKKIRLEDFLFQGEFMLSSPDLAMMWPMFEMAKDRFAYMPYINYIYNRRYIGNNEHKDYVNKTIALYYAQCIYNKKPYKEIQKLDFKKEEKADIVIISKNSPQAAELCLKSIDKYIKDFDKVFIFFENSKENEKYYSLKGNYPYCELKETHNFKSTLLEGLDHFSDNLLILSDHIFFKDNVELGSCIEKLDETHAKGLYFLFGNNITYASKENFFQKDFPKIALEEDFFAWHFEYGIGEWILPYSLEGTLMKKQELKKMLSQMKHFKTDEFYPTDNNIGLCYAKSKAIYLDFPSEEKITSILDEKGNIPITAEMKNNISFYYEFKGASL